MSRLRNVGRQAAGDQDLISLRDLNAFGATLPQLYVQRILLNAANGVPQLDVNSRMQNAYLPTDISRTNLTASDKVKAATLEVTAGSTLAGVSTSGNVSVGGSLSSIGAITGPSIDVGSGLVKGGTGDIPEITSDTFKAKATTLSSLTVPGATSLNALTLSGDLVAQGVSATALSSSGGITATGEVSAATIRSTTGSLIAEGPTSLQAVTVAGVLNTQAITAAQQIRGNGGFRLGPTATLSQVDSNNNNMPIKVAGGIEVNGALTNVTSLQTTQALTIGGGITATGKGTFASLESQGNLSVAGTLTGITDLSITGNLSVQGAGKQISATAVATGALNASGQSTLAGLTATGAVVNGNVSVTGTLGVNGAVSIPKGTLGTHALRHDQAYTRIAISYPAGSPTIATSGGGTQVGTVWTPIEMDSWFGSYDQAMLITRSAEYHTVKTGGIYLVNATVNFSDRTTNGATRAAAIVIDNDYVSQQDAPTYEGRINITWVGLLAANSNIELRAIQGTGSSLTIQAGVLGCRLTIVKLRDMS